MTNIPELRTANQRLADAKAMDTFDKVFIALCSNPTVVTVTPRANTGLVGTANAQKDFVPHIQPFLIELAMRLTTVYLSLDERETAKQIHEEVKQMLEHVKKNIETTP